MIVLLVALGGIAEAQGNHTRTLNAGWNAVAFPQRALTHLEAPFVGGLAYWDGGSYTTVQATVDEVNGGEGTLRGFWFFATKATTMAWNGQEESGGRVMTLRRGWNLVSFPNNGQVAAESLVVRREGVSVGLATVLLPQFQEIGPDNQSTVVDVSQGARLQAGRAYWVYASSEVTLGYSVTPAPSPVGSPTGQLYLVSVDDNEIVRYSNALNGNNLTRAATIRSGRTFSSGSYFEACCLDVPGDRMYVANPAADCVQVWERLSTRNGTIAPDREIRVDGLDAPLDVALDTTRDLLYVLEGANVIRIGAASTATGTVPGTRFRASNT